MATNAPRRAGRHFLQLPGPSPVPERILNAMSMQVIDHRGPDFQRLGNRVLAGLKGIFNTAGPVIIYPASGTGAWEAALVNTMSPGDARNRSRGGFRRYARRNPWTSRCGRRTRP